MKNKGQSDIVKALTGMKVQFAHPFDKVMFLVVE